VALAPGATRPFREVTAIFLALDVGDAAPRGTEMARSVQPASGERPARFRYHQDLPLPAGSYRVDLLGDGAPWRSLPFRVEHSRREALAPAFPLDAARTWSYDFVQTAGDGARLVDGGVSRGERFEAQVEMRVAGASRGPAHVKLLRDGAPVSEEWWTWDERGLLATRRTLAGETYELDPAQPLLVAAPGAQTWEYVNPELGIAQRSAQWGPLMLTGPWGRALGFLVLTEQAEDGLLTTVEREFVPARHRPSSSRPSCAPTSGARRCACSRPITSGRARASSASTRTPRALWARRWRRPAASRRSRPTSAPWRSS
jgi:hypothetical protein